MSIKGYYCPEGTAHMSGDPCSVGFFCEGGVQDKKPCEAEAGKFCAAGGGTPEGVVCHVGFFCVGGTAAPQECADTAPGYYCGQVTRSAHAIFERFEKIGKSEEAWVKACLRTLSCMRLVSQSRSNHSAMCSRTRTL